MRFRIWIFAIIGLSSGNTVFQSISFRLIAAGQFIASRALSPFYHSLSFIHASLRQVTGKKRAESWKERLRPGVEFVSDAIDTAMGVPQDFLSRGILGTKYAAPHQDCIIDL